MSRTRSPNYPSMSLGEAIEAMRPILEKDGRNKISRPTVARHLGYTSLNGRSLGKIGALRAYGLLDGNGDELRVSDTCMALLRAPENSPARREAIREAFDGPPLFRELNAERGDDRISKENLVWQLDQRGFTPEAAQRAAETYLESEKLVSQILGGYVPNDVGGANNAPSGGAKHNPPPPPPPNPGGGQHAGYALMAGERLVFTEEDSPQQYVKLVASGQVSPELLDALDAYVKRQRNRLAKAAFDDPKPASHQVEGGENDAEKVTEHSA